jgi:aspartate-semialdehyde dehydrogenase
VKYPYAFNLFSHNTAIDMATGYNDEESKVIKGNKKIFEDDGIAVSATCIRVPVLRAFGLRLTFECERPITPEEVKACWPRPGRQAWTTGPTTTPMPKDASSQGDVLAGASGRICRNPSASDQYVHGGRSIAEGGGTQCYCRLPNCSDYFVCPLARA